MSWKPEVQTDNTGKWYRNGVTFATKEEAETSAYDLAMRWTSVKDWRACECDDAEHPVTHAIVDGKMEHLK